MDTTDSYDKKKAEFEDWVSKWEAAQKAGVFKSDKPEADEQVAGSFFGVHSQIPNNVKESDIQCWTDVYRSSGGVINETKRTKEGTAEVAKKVAQSANPIRQQTTGADQDLSPKSVGETYTKEELDTLEDLKKQLHELCVKVSTCEGKGQSSKAFDSKIKSLKAKIDELSDSMGVEDGLAAQGD